MTVPCDLLEREGLLDRDDERALRHIEECAECRALLDKHQRIRAAFPRLGAAHGQRPDFEARMLAAIAREGEGKPARRRWWGLGLGVAAAAAVAAALLFLLMDRSAPQVAGLRIEVMAGGAATRTTMHQVGDILDIHASAGGAAHAELRVYRNDTDLVLHCPSAADARCTRRDHALAARLVLDAMGRYQVLWLTSDTRLPGPGSSLEHDVARAARDGARHELREIEVR
jgi:hypothetical protein